MKLFMDSRFLTILMFVVTILTTIFHNLELTIASSGGVIVCALWEVCESLRSNRIEIILKNKLYEHRVEL